MNFKYYLIIPIILFSVNIWNTVHQGSSMQSNSIAYEILTPIKFAVLFFNLYAAIICYKRYEKLNV